MSSSTVRESDASSIIEIRTFWHVCTLLAASQRLNGPSNPQAADYLDDLAIIAKHTKQIALKKRIQQVIYEHNTGLSASRLLAVL